MKLYRELADEFAGLIVQGTLQMGDRVPSVRRLCHERKISPATAMRAYEVLESRGLVEIRPRSGYYVSDKWRQPAREPQRSRPPSRTTYMEIGRASCRERV